MLGRFISRFFWNIYDYLGAYLVSGLILVLVLLAGALLATWITQLPPGVGMIMLLLLVVGIMAALGAAMGGTLFMASRVVKDDVARIVHFTEGVRTLGLRLTLCIAALAATAAVLVGNIWFYFRLATGDAGDGLRLAAMVAAMLFFWLTAGFLLYTLPLLALMGRPDSMKLRDRMRAALVSLVVAPLLWIFVGTVTLMLSALFAATIIGIVFIPAIISTAAATAHDITESYAGFLGQAHRESPPGTTTGAVKRRARELYREAEAAKPARTFRELIRPWEA